jgi:hypothetical protein
MKYLTISAAWLFVAIFLGISFLGVLSNYFPAEKGIFGLTYMLISVIRFPGTNLEVGYKLSDVIYLNFLNYLQFGLGVIVSAVGSVLKKRQELITA